MAIKIENKIVGYEVAKDEVDAAENFPPASNIIHMHEKLECWQLRDVRPCISTSNAIYVAECANLSNGPTKQQCSHPGAGRIV